MIESLDKTIRELEDLRASMVEAMERGIEDHIKYREKVAGAAAFKTCVLKLKELRHKLQGNEDE